MRCSLLPPALALAMLTATACGRAAPPPPLVAEISGTASLPGLSAPVRVVRDRWGVPHIYAQTQDDLFLAQGYVQAQDRLFQMDLWRRSARAPAPAGPAPNAATDPSGRADPGPAGAGAR